MNTSRYRQRRKIIVSATTDRPRTVAPQPEPATLIPLATSVSHGVRIPGQLTQHPRAGPVLHPQPRRVLRGHERTGKNQGRQDQPGGRGDGDRVRQRRRRAGRAALTAALAGGHALDVAHRTSPPAGISPRERSQLPATGRASCPAMTRASRARSVPVSSWAGTALSVASKRGP